MTDRTDANPVRDEEDAQAIGRSPASQSVPQAIPDRASLDLEYYKFNHKRRGKAVIINNRNFDLRLTGQREREGTEVDATALESAFIMLGFEVVCYNDLRTLDMSMNLRQVASEDHSDADCFVCAILSHGEEGEVYGTNGTMKLDNIFKMFKGDACPSLVGKPKLFFIQACRGRKYDWGVDLPPPDEDAVDAGEPVQKIPLEADVLKAYSVCPGYFSWRNNVDGSWFIQALVRVLQQHAGNLDLLTMLTIVNKHVAYDFQSCTDDDFTTDMKQMPNIVSTLTKSVMFTAR